MIRHPASASLPRCLAVAGAVAGGAVAVLTGLAPDLSAFSRAADRGTLGEASFDRWLVWACALVVSCCVVWLCGVTVALACTAATGRSGPRRVPPPVRRMVLAACGIALVGGAAPASAAPLLHADCPGLDLHGLPLPDRPTRATHVSRLVLPATQRPEHPDLSPRPARTAVVAAGDDLWSLAEEALPEGASANEITGHWRAIYRANRAVIGPDPNLIRPGQRLRLPPS